MSTVIVPPAEAKPFDPAAHINARNAAEQATRSGKPAAPVIPPEPEKPTPGAPAPEPPKVEVKADEDHTARLSRSQRREQNRLREEIGAERARREMLEQRLAELEGKGKAAPAAPDPEPARADFGNDADYNRALGRWEARQETAKTLQKRDQDARSTEEAATFRKHLEEMDTKAAEDRKALPDWDAVAKAAAESDDAIEVDWAKHEQLLALIGMSDQKAFVLYHFAKSPDELQRMLDLSKDSGAQIRAFHRLEGRLEKQYSDLKAAQASQPGKPATEDRTHLAEAEQAGRTAADRDVRKPKPSAAVTAPGGSAPPEEPAIGSRAWMDLRNRAQYAK